MEKQNPIKFKKVKEDGYYSYHLPIITQLGILESTIQECDIDSDLVFKLKHEVGIYSGLSLYDDPYLYSLMLRYLFQDNQNIMVTGLIEKIQKEYGKKVYELDIFKVHWSNRLEYSYDNTGVNTFSEFGFLSVFDFFKKVKHYYYRHNNTPNNANEWKYEATFLSNHLLKFFYKTYFSDVTHWCFLSGKDLKNTQQKLMNVDERPQVEELLNEVETMVTIQLGEDEGYEGYVLIYSKNDISDKITKMENMIVDFGTRYEKLLLKIETMNSNEEILRLVKEFLDGFDEEYGIVESVI